jgi:hypothetical protein
LIIIVGAPGVGKSTISKMILLYYANEGYVIRYVTNNNIQEIKKNLSIDIMKNEIILLDDFLGQHYLNLKDNQPNELKTLISYVKKNRHKKLILNSRITILNEAEQKYMTFRDIMEKQEAHTYIIDLDKMSNMEKAEIFYNHLYANSLPAHYLSSIKANKNYFKVIKHKNYNPRIIEYITKKRNYREVDAIDYLNYIMRKLDNPEDVWRDEFRNRLDACDRILMNTLYSLTDTMVEYRILEKAFNKRIIREATKDTSVNQYKDVIIRLTDSLLKNIDDKGTFKISVLNPSINDYLLSALTSNENEQICIIDNAIYYEQMLKVILCEESKEHFIKKLIEEDILKIKCLKNSSYFYFIKSVIKYNIYEKKLIKTLRFSFEKAYTNLSYKNKDEYSNYIYILFTEKFYRFYKLQNIFYSSEKICMILHPMLFDYTLDLINAMLKENDISDDESLLNVLKDSIVNKITENVQEELTYEISDAVTSVLNNVDKVDITEFMGGFSSYLEDRVWSELEDIAYEKIIEYISKVDKQLIIEVKDFDISEMRFYLDIENSLQSHLNEPDVDSDDYKGDRDGHAQIDSMIISMFER